MFFDNLTGWRSKVEALPFLQHSAVPSSTDWSQAMFTFCEHCVFWVTILVFASVGMMHAIKFAVLEFHETRKAIQEAAKK
jgi:hypothetical protein